MDHNQSGEIRGLINRAMPSGYTLRNSDWAIIKAAILAAQPPGEEEICAALDEFDSDRPNSAPHHIVLFADRSGGINTGADEGDRLFTYTGTPGKIPAAIRALIPKPEPTEE